MREIHISTNGRDESGNIIKGFQLRMAVRAVLSSHGFYLLLLKIWEEKVASATWDFPGGGMSYGESLIDALIREVREETGIEILSGKVFPIKARHMKDGNVYLVGIDFLCIAEKVKKPKLSFEHLSAKWLDESKILGNKSIPLWLKESVKLAESQKENYLAASGEDKIMEVFSRKKGLSFAIEGIDGAGKTTQALELIDYVNKREGNRGFYAKSPKGCPLAEKIMALVENPGTPPQVEMVAFLLSNMMFYDQIIAPKISSGHVVVIDRWTGSFMSYFNLLLNFCYDSLDNFNKSFIGDFSADRTFLLDVPAEVAVKRIKEKKNLSKYDKMDTEFMEKQRRGFLKLAEKYNWIIIDGLRPASIIKDDIISSINPFLR